VPRYLGLGVAGREANNGQLTTDNGQCRMWRFKGSPHYLDKQASRLGITQVLADRARNNAEIFRLAVLLAQLAERYHGARKENGSPVFYMTERAQIKGTLEQCELELQKLHMLAAAADAMLSEAWEAFGFPKPKRIFEVYTVTDTPILPLGDGTVGVVDD
jgi:hypothetical protein